MPIYEYRCTACGHQQEFLQKVSDAPLTVCTKCGQETFSKLVSAAGFQLKGSGWYATDFKSKASTPKPDAKGEPKAGGGSSEGGSSSGGLSSPGAGGSDGAKKAAPAGCGGNCACH